MKVRILRSALGDLEAGRAFYERQGAGLGNYFIEPLFSEIDSLALYGGIHREVEGFQRLLARGFPYAVYYRVIGGDVVVFRVLDCRRDPHRIRQALEEL